MSDIKRYEIYAYSGGEEEAFIESEESTDGEWCKYSDLKKALKDIQEDIKFSSCGVCHRVDLKIIDLLKNKE